MLQLIAYFNLPIKQHTLFLKLTVQAPQATLVDKQFLLGKCRQRVLQHKE